MKKIIFIFSTILIAATVTVLNVTPIKNTQPVQEVAKVEEVKQLEEIKTDAAETPLMTETVTQPTIEEPVIISEGYKQGYVATKYMEVSNYFSQSMPQVHIWFSHYFNTHLEQFSYETVDTQLAKVKAHFLDMNRTSTLIEVVERAKSLVL